MTCYEAFREKIYKARNMNLLLVYQRRSGNILELFNMVAGMRV